MKTALLPRSRLGSTLIGLCVLYTAASLYFGQTRPIDGDEGYYASAAGLVAAGGHPYRDFFYPQGPILPYIYAPVVTMAGHSLRALRVLSALMGALAMVPWLLYLRREYGQDGVGHGSAELGGATLAASALLLLLLDPHLLIWNTTVKTYAFCNLALSWGLWFLYRGLVAGNEGEKRHADDQKRLAGQVAWFAAAGLAIGLCAGARLLYVPLACFLAVGLVFRAVQRRDRRATFAAAAFASGAALAAVPLLIAWQGDPQRFWFNVLHYHQIRYSDLRAAGLGASPVARGTAALAAAGRAFLLNPYRLLVLMLAGVGWFSLIRPTWAAGLIRETDDPAALPDQTQGSRRAFQILVGGACAVFVATSLLPDPVYPQYLTPTVGPLMLPAAALGLAALSRRVLRLAPLGTVVIAVLLAASALLIQKPGIKADVVWTWRSYEAVCDAVRRHCQPGDLVVSFWPGYVFETETRFLPGMENHFALGVSSRLDHTERQHYRIAGPALLGDIFRARRAQVIIVGTWMNELDYALSNAQTEALLAEFHRNYVVVDRVDDVAVSVPR